MTENTPPEAGAAPAAGGSDGGTAVADSEEMPYTATTSDGQPTHPRPPRRIKPPSASFLKSRSAAEEESAEEESAEGELGAPNETETFDFKPAPPLGGPPPRSASPEPQLAGPPPRGASPQPQLEGAAPRQPAPSASPPAPDKVAAEVQELVELISSLETLKFLQPRLAKTVEEGIDSPTLVSFYRLAARALKEEVDQAQKVSSQFRREFERLRGRMNMAQAELAAAKVRPPSEGESEGLGQAAKETILKLEAQLEKNKEQKDRLLQDIQHMRNRAQMDSEIRIFKAREMMLHGIIPVLDSFHQAVASSRSSANLEDVIKGFVLIHGLLMDALEAEGLTEINAVEQPFDPRVHEAMGHVDTDELPDDTVYDQFQCGYMLGERLLRPARVRVSRHSSPRPPAPPAPEPANAEPAASPPPPAGQQPETAPPSPPAPQPAASEPPRPAPSPTLGAQAPPEREGSPPA
ncbi:MAG: nucleotide exchange factor GrpE [Armatimonadetes bacterium]|nr:nucleotide exchange factor GrpE [Armatimonadota bacterium]